MVNEFLADLINIAPLAGAGTYTFSNVDDERTGYVQILPGPQNQVTLHRIWTLNPRRGHGSAILKMLCALADDHGIIIKLKSLPFGNKPYPLSRDELFDWYARHGFSGEKREMIRPPRTNATAGSQSMPLQSAT